MPLLSKIEAAIALGVSAELLEHFTKKCIKPGGKRTLQARPVGGQEMFEEHELQSFQKFLNEPWPLPSKGKRPHVPSAIARDVKDECHQQCAICGHMDNGEVAHIEDVASTLNNSPGNLILLCPNHHTKYDLGFKPSNNVTNDVVRAAKLVKRSSRARIMQAEADVHRRIQSLIGLLAAIEGRLKAAVPDSLAAKVYLTEAKTLLGMVSSVSNLPQGAGTTDVAAMVAKKAPALVKLASGNFEKQSEAVTRAAVVSVVNAGRELVIELDELECPHCHGRGTTGLVGDFCAFCKGSQVVSGAKKESYAPDEIDEVPCPRCGGEGTTGLVADFCAYCRGSQAVSRARADAYDPDEIDQVECPRCRGRGRTGLVGDYCSYCHGSQVVSQEKANGYTEDATDEVECPRCKGKGTTGLVDDFCAYCHGSQAVSKAKAEAYDEDQIDEVQCPHCGGRGVTGRVGDYCGFCRGSQVVSRSRAEQYDSEDIDEVECPRCRGRGEVGLVGDVCKLCKGSCVVSSSVAGAFLRR